MLNRLIKISVIAILFWLPLNSFSQTIVAKLSASVVKGCIPLSVTFTNQSTEGGKAIDTNKYVFKWEMGDNQNSDKLKGRFDALYNNPGKKTVKLTILNLSGTVLKDTTYTNFIEAYPNPSVSAIVSENPTCEQKTVTFSTKNENPSGAPIVSYLWTFGDLTNFGYNETETHSYTKSGSYLASVIVTDKYGCDNHKTRKEITIIVNSEKPTASFTIDSTQTCSSKVLVKLTNKSTVTSGTIKGYTWNYGDGTTDTTKNATKTFTRSTSSYETKYITLTVNGTNGCSDSQTKTVTMYNPKPTITITDNIKTVVSPKQACEGNVTFSVPADNSISTISWDLNNDGSIENNSNTYITPLLSGTYSIALVASNPACSVKVVQNFVVEPKPTMDMSPKGNFFCTKEKILPIFPLSLNVTAKTIEWYTDINGAPFATTTGNNGTPPVSFKPDAIYDITTKITSDNGCVGKVTFPQTFQVYYPNVSFTVDKFKGCVPLTVKFSDNSTYNAPVGKDKISKTIWDYGDGSTVDTTKQATHIFNNPGTYNASLTIETTSGQCTIQNPITIKPGAPPVIDIKPLDVVVCSSFSLDGVNKSGAWLDYETYGSVNNPDYDSTSTQLIGLNDPSMSSMPINEVNLHGQKRNFKLNTNPNNRPGLYKVVMTEYYHDCPTTLVKDIIFRVKGPFAINHTPTIDCSNPFNVTIAADSIKSAKNWKWLIAINDIVIDSIKNQTLSNTFDFTKYGTGVYTSTLIAYNDTTNCIDSSKVTFTVTNTQADISLNDTTPCTYNKNVFLTTNGMKDQSFISKYTWKMTYPSGKIVKDSLSIDDVSKVQISPTERGVYQLQAIARDLNGCNGKKDTVFRAYKPYAGYKTDSIKTCLPIMVTFTDTSKSFSSIISRLWTTNGDLLVTLPNIKFPSETNTTSLIEKYSQAKQYSTQLIATDMQGCSDTASSSKGVNPIIPVASFKSDTKVCLGTAALFEVDSVNVDPYKTDVDKFVWDFGDGTPAVTVPKSATRKYSILHTYAKEITNPTVTLNSFYTIPSTITTCPNSSTSNQIDVKDASAKFNFMDIDSTGKCNAVILKLNAISQIRYDSIQWVHTYMGNIKDHGSFNFNYSPPITLYDPGIHSIFFTAYSSYKGCTTTTETKQYVMPKTIVRFAVDKSRICINDTVTFTITNDTMNVAKAIHFWNFGDGTSDYSSFTVKHIYKSALNGGINPAAFSAEYNKCKDTYTSNIIVRRIQADFDRGTNDKDTLACTPFPITFLGSKSVGVGASYSWNFGDGTPVETTTDPTHIFKQGGQIFTVKLSIIGSDSGVTCKDDEIKTIRTFPSPSVTDNVKKPMCEGTLFTIQLTPSVGTTIDSWQTDPTLTPSSDKLSAIANPKTTTTYHVHEHYNNVGYAPCVLDYPIELKVQNKPVYHGAGVPNNNFLVYLPNDTLKTKPNDQLFAYIDYSLNNDSLAGVSYKWEPSTGLSCDNCANPKINTDKDITYTLTMLDSNNCFTNNKIAIYFKTILESLMGLPSAFSPNTDGNNDVAIPKGWGVKEFLQLDIYNRWGQLVHRTNDITNGWDGTFNGRPQDPDTYAWTIKYKDAKDVTIEKKGYITLLR